MDKRKGTFGKVVQRYRIERLGRTTFIPHGVKLRRRRQSRLVNGIIGSLEPFVELFEGFFPRSILVEPVTHQALVRTVNLGERLIHVIHEVVRLRVYPVDRVENIGLASIHVECKGVFQHPHASRNHGVLEHAPLRHTVNYLHGSGIANLVGHWHRIIDIIPKGRDHEQLVEIDVVADRFHTAAIIDLLRAYLRHQNAIFADNGNNDIAAVNFLHELDSRLALQAVRNRNRHVLERDQARRRILVPDGIEIRLGTRSLRGHIVTDKVLRNFLIDIIGIYRGIRVKAPALDAGIRTEHVQIQAGITERTFTRYKRAPMLAKEHILPVGIRIESDIIRNRLFRMAKVVRNRRPNHVHITDNERAVRFRSQVGNNRLATRSFDITLGRLHFGHGLILFITEAILKLHIHPVACRVIQQSLIKACALMRQHGIAKGLRHDKAVIARHFNIGSIVVITQLNVALRIRRGASATIPSPYGVELGRIQGIGAKVLVVERTEVRIEGRGLAVGNSGSVFAGRQHAPARKALVRVIGLPHGISRTIACDFQVATFEGVCRNPHIRGVGILKREVIGNVYRVVFRKLYVPFHILHHVERSAILHQGVHDIAVMGKAVGNFLHRQAISRDCIDNKRHARLMACVIVHFRHLQLIGIGADIREIMFDNGLRRVAFILRLCTQFLHQLECSFAIVMEGKGVELYLFTCFVTIFQIRNKAIDGSFVGLCGSRNHIGKVPAEFDIVHGVCRGTIRNIDLPANAAATRIIQARSNGIFHIHILFRLQPVHAVFMRILVILVGDIQFGIRFRTAKRQVVIKPCRLDNEIRGSIQLNVRIHY